MRLGFVASGCVEPVGPTVAGYDWLAWLEVTAEPLPVAGFATCWLPVYVPVVAWLALSEAAKPGTAVTAASKEARPRIPNAFFISCALIRSDR